MLSKKSVSKKLLNALELVMINDKLKVKKLTCKKCGLKGAKLKQLIEIMLAEEIKGLTKIDLSLNPKMTIQNGRLLGSLLAMNKKGLESLTLNKTPVSHSSFLSTLFDSTKKVKPCFKSLKTLSLASMKLEDEMLSFLPAASHQFSNLRSLNLRANRISYEGALPLSKFLVLAVKLDTLDLG